MKKLGLLTVLLSIKVLLEEGETHKALDILNEVIKEAKPKD